MILDEAPADTVKSHHPAFHSAPLSDLIADLQAGFATSQRDERGTVQVRMNNVTREGQWDWSSITRVPASPSELTFYSLKAGDVLFNNTNSTELVGKSALFTGHAETVVFSNHFTRLRTNPSLLDPAFLAYRLLQLWKEGEFARICDK
ncbi:MAG: Type restriction enzyme MjaXIP specificity protein, partial [Verrucomicrobiales bacterium]|nr:Type restriction enzyme MjaXIP specificity protein [Verrucomicrobiales bacterium]